MRSYTGSQGMPITSIEILNDQNELKAIIKASNDELRLKIDSAYSQDYIQKITLELTENLKKRLKSEGSPAMPRKDSGHDSPSV